MGTTCCLCGNFVWKWVFLRNQMDPQTVWAVMFIAHNYIPFFLPSHTSSECEELWAYLQTWSVLFSFKLTPQGCAVEGRKGMEGGEGREGKGISCHKVVCNNFNLVHSVPCNVLFSLIIAWLVSACHWILFSPSLVSFTHLHSSMIFCPTQLVTTSLGHCSLHLFLFSYRGELFFCSKNRCPNKFWIIKQTYPNVKTHFSFLNHHISRQLYFSGIHSAGFRCLSTVFEPVNNKWDFL